MESTAFTPEKVNAIMNSLSLCGGYAAVALASLGSTVGTGLAGCAAVGAWKRCYVANKPAPFLLTVFAGAPLSQTIYAMILMVMLIGKTTPESPALLSHFCMGVFGGIILTIAAIYQGKIGAIACDMYSDSNKGFGNAITIVGIVETVALFATIFAAMAI